MFMNKWFNKKKGKDVVHSKKKKKKAKEKLLFDLQELFSC